jgi:hypothetical protein
MAHFIDTEMHRIVANVLVDARPRFAEFKRDASEVWVSAEIGGTVSIIDPVKHPLRRSVQAPRMAASGHERPKGDVRAESVRLPTADLYAFDLIELNGDDLRHDLLEGRKATLEMILAKAGAGIWFNEHMEGDGETVFAMPARWDSKASSRSGRIRPTVQDGRPTGSK